MLKIKGTLRIKIVFVLFLIILPTTGSAKRLIWNAPNTCSTYLRTSPHPLVTYMYANFSHLELDPAIFVDDLADEELANKALAEAQKKASVTTAKIRKVIEKRFHLTADTVFYPLIGSDSSTFYSLFPKARVFVGLDQLRFFSNIEKTFDQKRFEIERNVQHGFLFYRYSLRGKDIAATLLGGLKQVVPSFRLRRVVLFRPNLPPIPEWDSQTSSRRSRWKKHLRKYNPEYFYIHGLVEFDQGEGTEVQHYIHIRDVFLPLNYAKKQYWWISTLSKKPPNAVVVKGSMGVFQAFEEPVFMLSDGTQGLFQVSPVRKAIERWLKKTNGVLIEGEDEFSLSESPYDGVQRTKIKDRMFSYSYIDLTKWGGY